MNNVSETDIVARGTWLYGGTSPSTVIIVREDLRPGTGDYEDPPDIREDRDVECFQVLYESGGEPGEFKAGGGYYLTLQEAKASVEHMVGATLKWEGNPTI